MTQTANIDRASVSHRWTSLLFMTWVLLLVAGCGAPGPEDESFEDIATAESALTNGAAKINAGGTAARSPAAGRIPFRTS